MKANRILFLSTLVVAGACASRSADALVLNLDTIYSGPTPSGSAPWVTVTITDVAPNKVNLKIDHNASSSAGQFVSAVYLNIDPFVGAVTLSNEVNANKRNGNLDLALNGVHGASGNLFDLGVSFKTSNSGAGVNRLKPGEFWSADLTGTGLHSALFNHVDNNGLYVGAHMQGIQGGLSSHLTTPEPASMAAIGFGILGILGRRRIKRTR